MIAFISEGYFYIADLGSVSETGKALIKLNLRIPNEVVKTFDVDYNMNTVLLATLSGNVYLYDLPKALQNERILSKKKIQMGVDQDSVYDFLEVLQKEDILERNQER